MTVQGFWGLQIFPGKQYTQKVNMPFMITMASLTDNINTNTRCSLIIKVDGEEFVICSLIPEKLEQQILGLTLLEGEEVTFSVKGDNAIHLTGNYVFEDKDVDSDDDDQSSEATVDQPNGSMVLNEHDTTHQPSIHLRKRMASTTKSKLPKRRKLDALTDETYEQRISSFAEEQKQLRGLLGTLDHEVKQIQQLRKEYTPSSSLAPAQEPINSENNAVRTQDWEQLYKDLKNKMEVDEKKKLDEKGKIDTNKKLDEKRKLDVKKKLEEKTTLAQKKVDQNGQQPASARASTPNERKKPLDEKTTISKIRRLPNGLVVEDRKLGQGAAAKSGDQVGLRYVGKLVNGKKFDFNTAGPPFSFTLGHGKVIRGWDIGLAGMKVGGERKLTIPPALAYRQRGVPPDIPPNATLVFDIKLVSLK